MKNFCIDCGGKVSKSIYQRCKDCDIKYKQRNKPRCNNCNKIVYFGSKICRDCYIDNSYINYCLKCNQIIDDRAKFCWKCYLDNRKNNPTFKYKLTKKDLYNDYIINKETTCSLAIKYNCGRQTILNYLIRFNIKRRHNKENKIGKFILSHINKTNIYQLYHIQKKTIMNISKIYKVSDITIRKFFKLNNISVRNISDRQKGELSCFFGKKRPNLSEKMKGKNNPNWQNGISNLPYHYSFTKKLKDSIIKRDNFKCQNCEMSNNKHHVKFNRNLTIHHIDYNKMNCKNNNLITLCNICNPMANKDRDYWYAYYTYKMEAKICH